MKERQLEFEEEGRNAAYRSHITDNPFPLFLVLDEITDPRNLGALFRLADAARLSGIYLVSTTPIELPASAKRASRSTWNQIPFQTLSDIRILENQLGDLDWIALERTTQSKPFWNQLPVGPAALILGNEQHGVSQPLLDRCTSSIHLPMFGWNTSMNVAMAAGIAVYEWLRLNPISSQAYY